MIKFYRIQTCPFCDEIISKLEDLVVAHSVFPIGEELSGGMPTPYLEDGRRTYHSQAGIRRFIAQLEREVVAGRERQSDSCVIGPEGECL